MGKVSNVLILHASAGAGHKRAAEALAAAFLLRHPAIRVTVRDILDFMAPVLRKALIQGYLNLVRTMPQLWGYLYNQVDKAASKTIEKKIVSVFNKINTLSFNKFFKGLEPNAVVCTHFMPLEILSNQKSRNTRTPLYCVVTDFALHSMWVMQHVDCYYVANEEVQRCLIRRGQQEDKVKYTGIPIDPVFMQSKPQREIRVRLGLDPDLSTVLLLTGGFGVGPTVNLVRSFQNSRVDCQLLVVAGKNEDMKRKTEAAAKTVRNPIKVFGYVDNIHDLMDAADLIISKPGGLTSAEVLVKRKPLMIIDPIPGQEQRNCEYLLEEGVAVRLYEIADAPHKIEALLQDKAQISQMAAKAQRIARPVAALDIVEDILARGET